ncbi:MAG: hypothetical protein QM535_16565 [Limnohabitans sp.]|nr:hypothetical protein [Limnohabitans sp.]
MTDFVVNHKSYSDADLKAEIVYLALLANQNSAYDINVNFKGAFYRGFRKDKLDINFDPVKKDRINLDISRNGFYDILPESFSHNNLEKTKGLDPIDEFKLRKKEEKETRHFFNPLENEFFQALTEIENHESLFMSNLNANQLASIIREILAIDSDLIPNKYIVKMFFHLLKFNDSKAQNIETICDILENIIDEKVKFRITNQEINDSMSSQEEECFSILGMNTTLTSSQKSYLKKIHFEIGPLKNSEMVEDFFEEKKMNQFLNSFFNLFLPLHISYEYEVGLNLDDTMFEMGNENYRSRLGISTMI